ncbi:MAG: sodium:proton antiporter [Gammaproteobacteria bacterium]|nr:sodium:proton antiporter [Gammaproteobacteria bacterium]
MPSNFSWIWLLLGLAGVAWYAGSLDANAIAAQGHYGWLSLLPAVAALAICFLTRNVIFALFTGIMLAGAITGQYNIIEHFLLPSLGTRRYAEILLIYLWALGGLLGIWNRNGGAFHFASWVSQNLVKSRRSAKFFTWMMGVIFHQGGTISTVLTGTTVRPVADRENVSHEELSYIVDSTASPVATIIPFNVWPFYVAGLITIDSLSPIVTGQESAIGWFMRSIPFNFYGIIAVTFTFLFAIDKLPWVGKTMQTAIDRARSGGGLNRPGSQPMLSDELADADVAEGYQPALIDFFLPISVLLSVAIIPWIITGQPKVFEAFSLAVVSAMILSISRGMSVADAFDGVVNGIKGVTVGAIILGLAVTLGVISDTLGASSFIIQGTSAVLSQVPYILPAVLMLICMIVSFSIGSSFGTYAVVFPIALPLAYAISPEPLFFTLNFGAIMGGAVFGDQCSPISDTTILSSLACGADLMDHVFTQFPLAMTAAGISMLLYTGIAFFIFL